MAQTTEKTGTGRQRTLSIVRTFNLPINIMWKAWAETESFKKWWGPKDYTCPLCSIDFRLGGKYLTCMKASDGKEYWSTGVYREITPLKKIIFTDSFSDNKGNVIPASDLKMPGNWPLQLLVTLTFEDLAGNTKMSLQHEGVPEEVYQDCINGWQESFDKLERYLR